MSYKNTIDYYDLNAEAFSNATYEVKFYDMQDRFLCRLEPGSHILDFGCGSGRDAGYFLSHGFQVTATDGSKELCRIASKNIGIPVKHMLFQELADVDMYEGIWACSSILHLPYNELIAVLKKMQCALKKDGYIYSSFKYGTFEGERNGRYFTDLTTGTLEKLLEHLPGLTLISQWITGDVRPGREDEQWLNVILQKKDEVSL